MKRFIALLLTLTAICCLFTGCGEEEVSSTNSALDSSVEQPEPSEDTSLPESSEGSSTTTSTTASTPTSSTPASAKPASSSSKPASTSSKPATTNYNYHLLMFTDFSNTHDLDISSVVNYVVDSLDYKSKYCVDYDKESGMWFKYQISEANFLTELRKNFVISDAFFNQIKQQKTYSLAGPDTCEYKNGTFYVETFDGWGGGPNTAFYFRKLVDDKKGNLTLYYLYLIDDFEQHYIALSYTYSGSASYTFVEDKTHEYAGKLQSTSKAFIDSLRLKSVKKTESFPDNPEAQMQYDYAYGETGYFFYWYEKDPNHIELFGCAGEFALPCSCGDHPDMRWNFDRTSKTVTCPCGTTVMRNLQYEQKIYR